MASFTALNVEPESDVEEEIDNSKEIQVEDALKLYQQALKLHSQGPQFYDEAEDAYDALFASEIFKYPEALSEAKRLAKLTDGDDSDSDDLDLLPVAPGGAEAAPNSLPQILYLSYKNHGEFLVDRLAHQISLERERNPDFVLEYDDDAKESAKESLDFFAEALDRDETDSDLWRRTSRISRLLGSRRISRFCLEAALNVDGPETLTLTDRSDLEGIFAKAELGTLLDDIDDQFLTHLTKKKPLPSYMRALMDPFPRLPTPITGLAPAYLPKPSQMKAITVPDRSWSSVGRTLLARKKAELKDSSKLPFGQGYRISVPNGRRQTMDNSDPKTPRKLVTGESLTKRRNTLEQGSPEREDIQSESVILDQNGTVESPVVERKDSVPLESAISVFETPTENLRPTNDDESPIKSSIIRRESLSRPYLKRNSESAGLIDGAESARSRSKRLRSRVEPAPPPEEDIDPKLLQKQYEEQLEPSIKADDWLCNICNRIASSVVVGNFQFISHLRRLLWHQEGDPPVEMAEPLENALKDLKASLCNWDLNRSNLLLHGSGSGASVTLIDNADDSGLASFLEHSKPANKKISDQDVLLSQCLDDFVDEANEGWKDIEELSALWFEFLVKPRRDAPSMYLNNVWPIVLKETVTQLLVEEDDDLIFKYEKEVQSLDDRLMNGTRSIQDQDCDLMHLVQALFELHVDIYGKMTNASSKVDQPTRLQQRDRMRRWANLASQAVGKYASLEDGSEVPSDLALRYMWCTVIYVSLIDPSSREHVLLCLRDLKNILEKNAIPDVQLPNNMIMPEISAGAAEREIARLTTMDFFLQIFDPDSEDPLAVIESLEPILMNDVSEKVIKDSQEGEADSFLEEGSELEQPSLQQKHMSEFLTKASASLRLSLWHRLKSAYEKIEYPPMVLVCNFKSISIILSELKAQAYSKDSVEDRSANLVVWIRNLSDLIVQCLDIIRSKADALECMDEKNLALSLAASADATKLFHVFALWEDSLRVGQLQLPVQASGAVVSHKSAMNYLRDMQPKCWMLIYLLLKEAISQNQELFPAGKEDLAEMLMAAHNAFGRREYCRIGKKAFLKLMKTELINLDPTGNWELEMAQLLYDLYGIKICPSNVSLEDHGCNAEPVDRSSALEIIDPLMTQAMRMNIKDVLRSEIKTACEKMQAVIGTPRANSTHQSFNRRLILAHLKSPVNPMNLYRSVQGIGGISGMPVRTEYAPVANKHWFFLQGHLLLARYRSQKRTAPDTSSDLDDAINFFKLDLDFDSEQWESWYRLAQTYDAKIEEDVTWSADKINDPKSDLVTLQRNAINCYTMAAAIAIRTAETSFENASKLSELYTDFGNRVYASSRSPFSMKVFSLQDYERFCNADDRGTYKREPFMEMKAGATWHFASELFRQALIEKPDSWVNWYMLGKCLWKLHCKQPGSKIGHSKVIQAFTRAVNCVPEKKDSRQSDRDPILEPHYKLVSTIHKLVERKELQPTEGVRLIAATPHGRKAQYSEVDGWEKYILRVIKSLRNADKANWHHRMVARAAHIHYDDKSSEKSAAEAARQELAQQIFTKTMAVQVWRPENERAGRHFVYTTRYTLFFIRLLDQLGDKTSLEALSKRIRRKQGDFVNHMEIWQELCAAYLKLIRAQGSIPENHEDAVFKYNMPYEQFAVNADRLQAWGHSQLSLNHPTMDKLREVIELKKLNGNYMKAAMIDDLVGDTYARIYEQIVPGLMAKAGEEKNRDKMRIDRMLMNDPPAGAADTPPDQSATPTAAGENQPSASGTAGAHSSRPKAIGRTEVRKRAETLVSKLMAPSMHWRTKAAKEAKEAAAAAEAARLEEEEGDGDGDGDGEDSKSAAGGSLHDSADDESELSDVPDDLDAPGSKPSMFPGLKARETEEDGTEAEGGDEVEGDGEGEGEGDGDTSMADNEEYDTAQEERPEDADNADDSKE